ncbi:precorrin-3B C(17)-methyltransferase [Ferrimicrobium acidiphilum]|uniref:precorrin-3B C(17)-methyltransferase n=1 Tax=Ferrimicrobium acidiphilum TaxID=121039 RepID=UPI0023F55DC9|nr:precorrin-3B C(17)-methyltransferase [Ferrimicrobium acidiphilum]
MTSTQFTNGIVLSLATPPYGLAAQLGFREIAFAKFGDLVDALTHHRAVVIIAAYPIVVRALAQTLSTKGDDPAVVAIDESTSFVTVLAGAHHGGEPLARQVADYLGATPVITTASSALDTIALDQTPQLCFGQMNAGIQARVNRGDGISLVNPTDLVLSDAIMNLAHDGSSPVKLVISDRLADEQLGDVRGSVKTLTIGVGCSSDATADEVNELINTVVHSAGLDIAAIDRIATIDRRLDHPALRGLHRELVGYGAAQLDVMTTPSPSTIVHQSVGTHSVAEAAALLASGEGGSLVVNKVKTARVTVAIARRRSLRGSLAVVGIGPGSLDLLTPRAFAALRSAQYVIGFSRYLDLIEPIIERGQELHRYPIGQEIERVAESLALAARGNHVALVTSGDPAVYAMAQLVVERLSPDVAIRVIPGVTAAYAASSTAGAIVGHDHAMISLSDLLTPWSIIENRIAAAAEADFVIAFYNPRSKQRSWQLEKALALIGEHRRPTTPVLIASRVERAGARVTVTTLEDLDPESVDMETIVIVGATTTALRHGYLYTPRGYQGTP